MRAVVKVKPLFWIMALLILLSNSFARVSCFLPSIELATGESVDVSVACIEDTLPTDCSVVLSQPFAWTIKPTASGISLTYLDDYYSSVRLTATGDVTGKSVEVIGKDKDSNLFSCSADLSPPKAKQEKCMIMPISYSLSSQPPAVVYSTKCIDSSGLIKDCNKAHKIKAIGFSSQGSDRVTLPLVELNKRPTAGYLIVSEDKECSSYYHVVLSTPLPNFPHSFEPQCTRNEDCQMGKCFNGLCKMEICSVKPVKKGSVYFYYGEWNDQLYHSTTMDKFLIGPLYYSIKGDKVYILEGGGPPSRIGIMDISDPANPKLLYQTSLLGCGDMITMVSISSISNDNKVVFWNRCTNHLMVYDISSFKQCAGVLTGGTQAEIIKLSSGRYIFGTGGGKGSSGRGIVYANADDENIQDMILLGYDKDYCMDSQPSVDLYATGIKRPGEGKVRAFEHNGRYYLLATALNDQGGDPEADGAITLYDITNFFPTKANPANGITKVFDKKEFKAVDGSAIAIREGRIYISAKKSFNEPFSLYVFDMNGNELGRYASALLDQMPEPRKDAYSPMPLAVDSKYIYIGHRSFGGVEVVDLRTMKAIPLPETLALSPQGPYLKEGYAFYTYMAIGVEKNGKHYVLLPVYYKEKDGNLVHSIYTSFELTEECLYL